MRGAAIAAHAYAAGTQLREKSDDRNILQNSQCYAGAFMEKRQRVKIESPFVTPDSAVVTRGGVAEASRLLMLRFLRQLPARPSYAPWRHQIRDTNATAAQAHRSITSVRTRCFTLRYGHARAPRQDVAAEKMFAPLPPAPRFIFMRQQRRY